MKKTLVIGAAGQIGSDLVTELRKKYGNENVVASDIRTSQAEPGFDGPQEELNVIDKFAYQQIVEKHEIEDVYLLAAMLSATGEKNPQMAWELNMQSLSHTLDFMRDGMVKRLFFPSSIAVFGPTTPKENTPQDTVIEPSTVYGITKRTGEMWTSYYHKRYQADIRSIRYPGLISYKTLPGGGTTDYAVQIFYDALQGKTHECFLSANTKLPMMYMPDAIRGTIALMDAPSDNIKIRSSYNFAGISFTPEEIAAEIKKHIPSFSINYTPDFRQEIANSWPSSIDDSRAQKDWGWKPEFTLENMVTDMLEKLEKKLSINA